MLQKIFNRLFILFWIYAVLLLIMNLTPGSTQPLEMRKVLFVRMDYFFHCMAYIVLPVLYAAAAFSDRPVFRYHALVFGIAIMLLLATVPEMLQNFVPRRRFNWFDMLANFTGLTAGTLLSLLAKSIFKTAISKRPFASRH